jgi:hypothetical protein
MDQWPQMYFDMANEAFRVVQNNFWALLSLTLPPHNEIKDTSYLGNKARWNTRTHHPVYHIPDGDIMVPFPYVYRYQAQEAKSREWKEKRQRIHNMLDSRGGTFKVKGVDLRPSHEKYSKILRQSLLWRSVLEEVNFHLQVMTKDGFENECAAVGAKHLNGLDVWTGDAHSFREVEAMYTEDLQNLYGAPGWRKYKVVGRMPPFHDTFQTQLQTEVEPVLEMYAAAARQTQDKINVNLLEFMLQHKKLTAPEQTKLEDTTDMPHTADATGESGSAAGVQALLCRMRRLC